MNFSDDLALDQTIVVMISSYYPTPDLEQAPAIVQRLRKAFDDVLENLHDTANIMQAEDPDPATKMIHVPFQFEKFSVAAMYDTEQDLFTQLVARPTATDGDDRPAYTISIFLVGHHGEEDADRMHSQANAY